MKPWFERILQGWALALLLAPAVHAAAPIEPFALKFQVSRNGSLLGNNTIQLKQIKPGLWEFSGAIIGTDGLAMLAGATVKERSLLTMPKGEWQIQDSWLETKVAWRRDVKTITLQDGGSAYLYKDHKRSIRVPFQAGLLDQHSVTLALISDLRAGKGPVFKYRTLVKGKVETYTFRIVSEQALDTALGRLDTVKLERVRQSGNGKRTSIWFARDKAFLPVKFQDMNEKGDSIEMRIVAIESPR